MIAGVLEARRVGCLARPRCAVVYKGSGRNVCRGNFMRVAAPLRTLVVLCGVALSSCATQQVHEEDTQSWAGRPVADLEKHPVFLTMSVARTRTSDGTEIRNYLNGRAVTSCSGGGTVFRGVLNSTDYNNFTTCMQQVPTCNNLFYVKSGIVTQYVPIGIGGARCYTDERTRPGFSAPTDVN
jgi:hypothetical protein